MSRNVLVTGGSSGIGRAAVTRFARAGDNVWFTFRSRPQEADRVLSQARAAGFQVRAYPFDQGDWTSHQQLLAALPGPVDVLVNNAAVGSKTVQRYAPGPSHRQDAAFMQINCVGPLWLIRQLLPGMQERGYGKIVNVASVGGGVSQFPSFDVADGMSKAALAYLTRHYAAELVHSPVDICAVCPGAVETSMFEASTLAGLTPEGRRRLADRLPKSRLIQPEEIAELVWWLTTDAARVLHGAVIDASLGLGVHPGLLTGGSAPTVPAVPTVPDAPAAPDVPAAPEKPAAVGS